MSHIPFESLASLVQKLAKPPKSHTEPSSSIPPERIFASWLAHQHQPLAARSGKQIFRLLFPHEGARRRYGLKETLLARELSRVLGAPRCELDKWDRVDYNAEGGGEGCLGLAVMAVLQDRSAAGQKSSISIQQVDQLLDELASHSPYSALSQIPSHPRAQSVILEKLYRDAGLSPSALALLTQIILRDLRPLLNPLPSLPVRNPTTMLRLKSTAGPAQLDLSSALKVFSPEAWQMYMSGKGDLNWCLDAAEQGMGSSRGRMASGPVPGINVQIPKCRKGRSAEDALSEFTGSRFADAARIVWAETKYDGYRMQIHVQIINEQASITIFSKSKRNSTFDRINTHSIILTALGLPVPQGLPIHPVLFTRAETADAPERRVQRSIILEAEVVPYNEGKREGNRGPGIEEFWRLDGAGVTVLPGSTSLANGSALKNDRHLCLAFFDILHLDGTSFLSTPYAERRRSLESVLRHIPGFAFPVERTAIYLHFGRQPAINALRHAFNLSALNREEGLVLKSACSPYPGHPISKASAGTGDRQPDRLGHRWVKLKRDYVPDLGDCIDLVVLGAGWDMDRARELRVDTSVITTFYIGVLVNQEQVKARKEAPHFEVLFRASYGMSRDQLEVYNANVRLGRWGSRPYDRDDPLKRRLLGMSWTYRIPKSMPAPSLLFDQPMCCEVMGAGFQKVPWCNLYELRWPRLQKIFETRERPWTRALIGPDLLRTAHLALGYSTASGSQPISSPENDSIRALWRNASKSAIDVAESLPPTSPRKAGVLHRNQSAPDMAELQHIVKCSPPTPRKSGTDTGGALLVPSSAGRLQGAINRDTQKDDGMEVGGQDEEDDDDRQDGLVVIRTPPSKSHSGRRWALRSPLFSLSPNKGDTFPRAEQCGLASGARGESSARNPMKAACVSCVIGDVDGGGLPLSAVEAKRGQEPVTLAPTMPYLASPPEPTRKKRKTLKPLSLRSRILLAIRQ